MSSRHKPGGTRDGKREGPAQGVEQGRKKRIRKNKSGLEGVSGIQADRMDRNIKEKNKVDASEMATC